MLKMRIYTTVLILAIAGCLCSAAHAGSGAMFVGQDLHMQSGTMTVYTDSLTCVGDSVMLFEDTFCMDIGANKYSSDLAVVRITPLSCTSEISVDVDYEVSVYLQGSVGIAKLAGAKTTAISEVMVENGESMSAKFLVTGNIFATADTQRTTSYATFEANNLFACEAAANSPAVSGPCIAFNAKVPTYQIGSDRYVCCDEHGLARIEGTEGRGGKSPGTPSTTSPPKKKTVQFEYPVNIAALWDPAPVLETSEIPGGCSIATMIGRFYLWQKQDEEGGLLEFQADSAVMFYSGDGLKLGAEDRTDDVMASGPIDSVYLRGDIVMTEGGRTVRAKELFYNFRTKEGLALQGEIRMFDENRSIPVYIRADMLRKVSDNVFAGSDMTVTTSEFHTPQISLTASKMVIADLSSTGEGGVASGDSDQQFDALLKDIRMDVSGHTVFKWGKLRSDFERPDLPIKRLSVGNNSRFGTQVETQWYLARILGIKEAEGVDSTLLLDYASKRGPGAGVVIDYERPDYYGGISGYIINDKGEDRLGRASSRKNLEPANELRGRFTARHRHYLPYNWQATLEVSYLSDENFLESFFRDEFNESKADETLVHLKRLQDNWAVSFLAKVRINDFAAEAEELPTLAYHLKGQSFWDHKLTFYSDTSIGRRRDRLASDSLSTASETFYTFATTRNEVDMPMLFRSVKIVPYIAGTYALDDLRGFHTNLDEEIRPRQKSNGLAEAGLRFATMFWKDSQVQSEFWDICGLRHTVLPHVEFATFSGNKSTILMRDMVNLGLSQKWQTHRGPEEDRRTVDWMRLDVDATFVSSTADDAQGPMDSYGPARFIWNNQNIPLLARRSTSYFGTVRDTIGVDYEWQLSDTTNIISDMVWDIQSGVVQQFDMGVTRYVFPDISYYIGNRYLKPVVITSDGKKEIGSNALIGAISYALNSKYTAAFAAEYNLDYGKTIESEFSLIRRYHRLYYGLTFALDETLDDSSVTFSVWPQGVKDLAFGSRKLTGLSDRVMAD